jgi:radical SAM peptide maturase (CXXX-repeat target family)/CXXX repeat peptide maturase
MSFETAKAAVDFFLDQPVRLDAVVWDFIGGEPTLEMSLIDRISDYIKIQMYKKHHPWFDNYMFSIGTNGILYDTPAVQNYIKKNKSHVSFGLTIDGTKEKHDLQRVYKDGSGSYDKVYKNVKLWLSQFPDGVTKVTFSSDDLKYLKDSIIHLWETGLKMIPANVVFEDVWKPGDVEIFENQLRQLADYVLSNELFWDYSVRFFDPTVGYPVGIVQKKANYCGSGKMVAVDCDGKLYPCIRFLEFCLSDKSTKSLSTGSIQRGFNKNILEAFDMLNIESMSDDECNTCPVASGCFACAGNNFNCNESHTIFKKTKYHCELQKAQVRVNHYFWDQIIKKLHMPSVFELEKKNAFISSGFHMDGAKYLFFVLNDYITPHCMYTTTSTSSRRMSKEAFSSGIAYAYANEYVPIFLGNSEPYLDDFYKHKFHVRIDAATNMKSYNSNTDDNTAEYRVPIYNASDYATASMKSAVAILLIQAHDLPILGDVVLHLAAFNKRINIIKQDLPLWEKQDFEEYQNQVNKIEQMIHNGIIGTSINIVHSTRMGGHRSDCLAGISEFTFAPDEKIYLCPAAYFSGLEAIGNLDSIYMPDKELRAIEKSPKCAECKILSCLRCPVLNNAATSMLNVPSREQCLAGVAELNAYNDLHFEA